MDVKKLGEAIRYLRLKEGLTQQDIADQLGISFQAVSKWERGKCIPDAACLPRLAERLNVDLDDLLDGNITYRDNEWCGLLELPDWMSQNALTDGAKPLIDVLLAYFMLAGIRDIVIRGSAVRLSQLKMYLSDAVSQGLHLTFQDAWMPVKLPCPNVMLVTEPVFLYGSNLTKYFWRAMARRDGVSVLTAELHRAEPDWRVAVNRQRLVRHSRQGHLCRMPIMFFPASFADRVGDSIGQLAEAHILYSEPVSRGMIIYRIGSEEMACRSADFIGLLGSMTGEAIYELPEIARERKLLSTGER